MRDWPNIKAKGKEVYQAPNGVPDQNAPERNCLYALEYKGAY